jgi:hypothetical protein
LDTGSEMPLCETSHAARPAENKPEARVQLTSVRPRLSAQSPLPREPLAEILPEVPEKEPGKMFAVQE